MKRVEREMLKQLEEMEDFLRDCSLVRNVRIENRVHYRKRQGRKQGAYFEVLGLDDSGIRIRLGFGSWYRNVTVYVGKPGTRPTIEEFEELKRYLKRYQTEVWDKVTS